LIIILIYKNILKTRKDEMGEFADFSRITMTRMRAHSGSNSSMLMVGWRMLLPPS